jgi:CRISPR-associated endonuclease/helicase Cas3
MNSFDFHRAFLDLTGFGPLSWQARLYEKHFAKDDLPPVIDLSTGLGKTMVMAIWLIARANKLDVPTRLIYVVDRRTVVDQATDLAKKLRDNCKQALVMDPPAISTLRGQLADNREWSRDPSRPAIIIGTVDLIGSALLFSGYRSSYKRRPLEAGLLGQGSLLVLDEAHLSKPFEKLLGAIGQFNTTCNTGVSPVKPMRVIRMSATSAEDDASRFKLEESDLNDKVIEERFTAKKRLTITRDVDPKKLNDTMAGAAIDLARNQSLSGTRIVVFVRKPDDAKAIAQAVSEHVIETVDESGSKPRKVKTSPYKNSVEILTGTMRGLERDELVEKPVLKRFLNGDEVPGENDNPVFLISTSAGEVGFDLNADRLVGDEAPLDSWIQRLGRVNRRGKGTAIVQVFAKTPAEKKEDREAGKHTIDSASANAIEALEQLPKAEPLDTDKRSGPIFNASPCALRNLAKADNAISPKPTTVDLTEILLDAWSMTSITEPMPGRPEVGPWLRGINDELPQTTIVWRAELDLLAGNRDLEAKFKAIFATHRIRPHESLTTNSSRVIEFLQKITKDKGGRPELRQMQIVIQFARTLAVKTIGDLIDHPSVLNATNRGKI